MPDQAPERDPSDLIELTVDVVSAYARHNAVSQQELVAAIGSVHQAFVHTAMPEALAPAPRPEPAVPGRRSITQDFLISLEDGKHYKTLKRHLGKLGLTPDEYRKKWGLPADYPMVAPNYAIRRSELARDIGLGRQRRRGLSLPRPATQTGAAGSSPAVSS